MAATQQLPLTILCGKGGVGKTTLSLSLALRAARLGLAVDRAMMPRGCDQCEGTGYRGRFLLAEMLTLSRSDLMHAVLARDETAAIEKLAVRKSGMNYRVTIHVQADAGMSLHDAHVLGGKVKSAIRAAMPKVQDVLVHMEPFESPTTAS